MEDEPVRTLYPEVTVINAAEGMDVSSSSDDGN